MSINSNPKPKVPSCFRKLFTLVTAFETFVFSIKINALGGKCHRLSRKAIKYWQTNWHTLFMGFVDKNISITSRQTYPLISIRQFQGIDTSLLLRGSPKLLRVTQILISTECQQACRSNCRSLNGIIKRTCCLFLLRDGYKGFVLYCCIPNSNLRWFPSTKPDIQHKTIKHWGR